MASPSGGPSTNGATLAAQSPLRKGRAAALSRFANKEESFRLWSGPCLQHRRVLGADARPLTLKPFAIGERKVLADALHQCTQRFTSCCCGHYY